MDHEHEIPGAPARIMMLEEGDEVGVPHWVEDEFRSPQPRRPSPFSRDELLAQFSSDFEGSTWDASARVGCLRDWRMLHPSIEDDLNAIADSIDPMVRISMGSQSLDPSAISPPPRPPYLMALGVCSVALVLVECLLIALRVGGALAWDWGWVLASIWLPVVLATAALLMATIVLGAMDERDASRLRRSS